MANFQNSLRFVSLRRFGRIATALLLACLFARSTAAQWKDELPEPAKRRIESILAEEMQSQRLVGLAVGVIWEGRIAYLNGFGYADREEAVPVDDRSLFRWASISKPLTAVAAMQLWEQETLDLDCDVKSLVPEFDAHSAVVTPRQLLCHQGGIVHYSNGKVVRTRRSYPVDNPFENVIFALDTFKESPLVCEPGEKFSYTTHGYILLSAAVERAGKQAFADQVRERIVKPLGLKTLQPDYQWVDIPHRVKGYRPKSRQDDAIVPSTNTDVSWKLGGGGYLSNVDDMALFALGLMGDELLSDRAKDAMWVRQATRDGEETPYGLGFRIAGQGDELQVSHGGSQEKTRTQMLFYPAQGRGVVLMCNTEGSNMARIAQRLDRAVARIPRPAATKAAGR